ncbi:putative serine/threonine-protein kinase PIX13 [Canna indica]|uniref:Serine/threonine-protein kinase PIX13 n=1 Tax=Canna indica TaxID=4628 RepID=A0AAQ3KEP0_9LILI|nr:putative serine/threonine-protein kinase PIX13 [Canna indica]
MAQILLRHAVGDGGLVGDNTPQVKIPLPLLLICLIMQNAIQGRREIIERDQPEASPDEGTNVQDASPNLGRSSIESERSRKKMITSIKRWAKDSLHKFFKPKKGSEVGVNYDSHHLFVQPNVGFEVEVNYGASFRIFSLSELKRATKGFASNNIVGRGEFTVVYEGMLDSIAVAVKKWAQQSSQGSQEWENEMNILQNMSHPNLIRLLGYCQEEGIVLLVYEFMANRSLEHHLLEQRNSLTWNQRIKIAIGTARALNFLHTSEKRIIHRGLKPGVILLDSDFNAKLSGLGWSRDGPAGEDPTISTQVLGVPGYLDPRYIMTGHLDTKTDVYAFGIILLQMLSGRKVFDVNLPVDRRHIVQFAKPLLSNLTRLMDPKLNGQYKWKDAFRLAQLSECCVSNDVKKRPNVVEIVKVLESVEH